MIRRGNGPSPQIRAYDPPRWESNRKDCKENEEIDIWKKSGMPNSRNPNHDFGDFDLRDLIGPIAQSRRI
jgi:hypothetical protein